MSKRNVFIIGLALFSLVLAACGTAPAPTAMPTSVPPSATPVVPPISEGEAKQIASQSTCMQSGTLKDTANYNPSSNTWWIDMAADKPNCNPACVVDVKAKTAEVNWRCTGALVPTATPASAGMANPASENCVKQGGTVSIQKRGDGGEYGICLFEDNRQCEEWALLNGECPVGGLKITGYITPAAQYCAISGGTYTITGNSGAPNETGTCAFKNGKSCAADEYYNGTCNSK